MKKRDHEWDILANMTFGTITMRRILNERELFADQEYFQRKEILERVIDRWEQISGERLALNQVTGPFKHCMKRTPELVPFIALGHYGKYKHVLERADVTAQPVQSRPRTAASEPHRETKLPPPPQSPSFSPRTANPPTAPSRVREQWRDDAPVERNLGDGSFRVYAWCHPHDAKKDGHWPIKVGRTGKGGLKSRIDRSQMKEYPRYLLCMRFQTEDKAIRMERALHICLNFRDRRCSESLGREWFRTSPQELVELAQVINPNLQEWDTPPLPSW
ncbi:MAG: GIY-YIG nuclease family protein [Bryobacterales bacterium]|nr:GIY-YIG nuclease family protein [Bryobacterales bacterium]